MNESTHAAIPQITGIRYMMERRIHAGKGIRGVPHNTSHWNKQERNMNLWKVNTRQLQPAPAIGT